MLFDFFVEVVFGTQLEILFCHAVLISNFSIERKLSVIRAEWIIGRILLHVNAINVDSLIYSFGLCGFCWAELHCGDCRKKCCWDVCKLIYFGCNFNWVRFLLTSNLLNSLNKFFESFSIVLNQNSFIRNLSNSLRYSL